jgi:hypothetical protein
MKETLLLAHSAFFLAIRSVASITRIGMSDVEWFWSWNERIFKPRMARIKRMTSSRGLWSAVSWHRFPFHWGSERAKQRGLRKKAPPSRSTPKLSRCYPEIY